MYLPPSFLPILTTAEIHQSENIFLKKFHCIRHWNLTFVGVIPSCYSSENSVLNLRSFCFLSPKCQNEPLRGLYTFKDPLCTFLSEAQCHMYPESLVADDHVMSLGCCSICWCVISVYMYDTCHYSKINLFRRMNSFFFNRWFQCLQRYVPSRQETDGDNSSELFNCHHCS